MSRLRRLIGWLLFQAFGPNLVTYALSGRQTASMQHVRLGPLQERVARDALYGGRRTIDVGPADCGCGGTGVVLVEGPCDSAPLEAPCHCIAGTPKKRPSAVDAASATIHEERTHGRTE